MFRFFSRAKRTAQQSRAYQYDADVYGFRLQTPITFPEFTKEQLQNRIDNANLLRLVSIYRTEGHKLANLDPLGLSKVNDDFVEFTPEYYGLDRLKSYPLTGIFEDSLKSETATLNEIISKLKSTYCGRLGFEYEYVPDISERRWFASRIESFKRKPLSNPEKLSIFETLTKSEVFDHFMAKKFPQVKRYGLEGAESMMVALDSLFRVSNNAGIAEAVVCMPHRGRMNLLTGTLQLSPTQLFHKVKGNQEFPINIPGIGDVISHVSRSVDLDYGNKEPIHVSLLHNPSHLEAANPVAMGKTRAKQLDRLHTEQTTCNLGDRVVCFQLHGDAAFSGQGVVTETLGLSNLPHFTCGGSIHVIVNNQVGYTTTAMNSRSTIYSSDIGKMINSPVIHVNADHPEDVTYAIELAFDYRHKFKKDVIVDLIAYRRWGHNELDEPAFTQPMMYKVIRGRKSVPSLYEDKLKSEGVITEAQISTLRKDYFDDLSKHLEESYSYVPTLDSLGKKWSNIKVTSEIDNSMITGVDIELLKDIGLKSVATADSFTPHPRLKKYHIDFRVQRVNEGTRLDWATCEAMMFGSLLVQGYGVRISGQDVGRGTFSQRHIMLIDQTNEKTIIPLNNIKQKQEGLLEIANSHLSEFAVLGFEVGVSWESPSRLCIWEAQFGDFFNGAQIIIDTYLASGEAKWFRQCGLVMLLPHGYDGAGPEHSSCRMERFLQLCDQRIDILNPNKIDNPNMHVVNPTTPAQFFHVMRRQMIRNYRKPLIVVGPKTLLRHPAATSSLSEMGPGTSFQRVLTDPSIKPGQHDLVERVIFITGKFYYDLVKRRNELKLGESVAIVRIEEICPFPTDLIQRELELFSNATEFIWTQEEAQNQGAYTFVAPRLEQLLPDNKKLNYVGRDPLCAPAVGVSARHKIEQEQILTASFA